MRMRWSKPRWNTSHPDHERKTENAEEKLQLEEVPSLSRLADHAVLNGWDNMSLRPELLCLPGLADWPPQLRAVQPVKPRAKSPTV